MATLLPPPKPLEVHDCNAAKKWKNFESSWTNYAVANDLKEKPEPVQVCSVDSPNCNCIVHVPIYLRIRFKFNTHVVHKLIVIYFDITGKF